MVSSLPADAVADPTAALKLLFLPDNDVDAFPAAVTAYFSRVFNTLDALQEIPELSLANPPEVHRDRSLVRFRAMVQDTSPSPEMYLAKHADATCGGWGLADATQQDEAINYADLRECTVIWAVTVPGENAWCPAAFNVESTGTRAHYTPPHPHKFPIPNASHIGVQVKIYDTAESLRSTDILTFVGILTSEPLHVDLDQPSPSLVPTLHVFFAQPHPPTIVPRVYPHPASIVTLRDELIAWIADESLAGDRDAAEWTLLCAIGRVQSRTPPILPLSLTLSRFPSPNATQNTVPGLSHVLSQILPLSTTLPLSLHTLNTTSFSPESKDEDLHSGWLQLPSGSVCVVTEGGVTEGGVFDRGIANLRAVQEMMNAQTLEYVFPFSRFSFNTDVAFVVLSEGRKSAFFQTGVNVPLQPSKEGGFNFYKSADEIVLPPPDKLDAFRSLIGGAKVGNVTIGDGAAEFIQEDFVNQRKAADAPAGDFTADDLVHRMMVAKLLALSSHESDISVVTWERAKALEAQRKARI